MLYFKKLRPSIPIPPGMCPCRNPAALSLWEADLLLCPIHAREWLRSAEKQEAVLAIEIDDNRSLQAAVDTFVKRIRRRPSIRERLSAAWHVLRGS
jgi:hypothetical protein